MRRTLLLPILFALGLSSAEARIGETLDQCTQRYGDATPIPTPYEFAPEAKELVYYKFVKNGIVVQIGILNGKAADLSFSHEPPPPPPPPPLPDGKRPIVTDAPVQIQPPSPLSAAEVETLLAANSMGKKWKVVSDGKLAFFADPPTPNVRYGPYWLRDDGVFATVDAPYLHIFTKEWMTYFDQKTRLHRQQDVEIQKKNLEGF